MASADGGVYAQGNAGYYGSLGNNQLAGPGGGHGGNPRRPGLLAGRPGRRGLRLRRRRLLRLDGRVPLNQPIVGMASTPDGKGYWLVASDGGVFAFGDAPFLGSMGGRRSSRRSPAWPPPTAARATGWWPVTAASSPTGTHPSMARTVGGRWSTRSSAWPPSPDDGGYYLVTTDGGCTPTGTPSPGATSEAASTANRPHRPARGGHGVAQGGAGYWLLDPDGSTTPSPTHPTRRPRRGVGHRRHRRHPGERRPGHRLLLQSVRAVRGLVLTVRHLGVAGGRRAHPAYAFTGDMYDWAAAHTGVLPPWAPPPG